MNCSLMMDEFQSSGDILHDHQKSEAPELFVLKVKIQKLGLSKGTSDTGIDEIVKTHGTQFHIDVIVEFREPSMIKNLDNVLMTPIFNELIDHIRFIHNILLILEIGDAHQFSGKYLYSTRCNLICTSFAFALYI